MIYDIANTTIKSCDPDGIVFGDTIRSVLTPDNVLKVISEYVDVLSYQPDDKFVNLTEMKRIHDVAGGKPMIIADIGFGTAIYVCRGCTRACVCACVRGYVGAWVRWCVRVCMCEHVHGSWAHGSVRPRIRASFSI